ncbi:MAG TPA: CHAT domain-containing tetratricopeptide repeat protein [Terriglobales bacterium]|nr:CHAT domain-containing tetratricopeptide repeat protein [Terriglobales bacterium]
MGAKATPQTESDALIQQLVAATNEHDRHALIAKHPVAMWSEIVNALTERVWQEVRVDTNRAERLADAAIAVAEEIQDAVALGKSYRAKANALYALDHHSDAVKMHARAAEFFASAGEDAELARTLSGSIQPLLLLGRYEEALAAGERARAIFTRHGNSHRLARLEINLGNIYHRQDRFPDALACYERAYEGLAEHDDAEGLAAVLSNLSLTYISLSDFPKALAFHRKARQHCEAKGMPTLVAYADYNIAYLYFLRGEYGRAIQTLRDAALSAKRAGDAYQVALCNLDLAEIYLELNLSSEAGELAREARDGFRQLGFGYEAAKALAFAAIAASRLGQAFEGIRLFAEAKEMFVRDHNLVWPSLIDLYTALVLFKEGRLFEARRLSSAAHAFFAGSALRHKAILAELLLARISLRMSDSVAAKTRCQNALVELIDLDSPALLFDAEFLMGEVERSLGNEDVAYECYRRAREATERLRGGLRGEELKIAFFENKLEVYENLVELSMRRPDGTNQAFCYIQEAKSRTLADILRHPLHVSPDTDAGQSELVRSIRNLREELNWYYNLIEREQLRPEERSAARIENLEQEARARESDLAKALREATAAEANQAGLELPVQVSLEQIQATLHPDTAIVEYFSVKDRAVACVLTRDNVQIQPVTVQKRVRKLLQLLQFQISKFRLDPEYVNNFSETLLASTQAHLHALYEELIAPARHLLATRHLVFAPHGVLHYVPFHALHSGNHYLIDQFSISYAPSASVYALCQQKRVNTAGPALLLGVPDAQAPVIQDEVQALSDMLPDSRMFLSTEAAEDKLRMYGPESRIIHIASHGYFRQDNPMFSSIRLGQSHLSLYDLYHLHLPAELIVLSGCATGMNVVSPGDELIGLVRGLLQAGAQNLVLSLWDVHDASTKQFMIDFYARLQQGHSYAAALQSAMLELRQRYPHPYYWAPFALIGKG